MWRELVLAAALCIPAGDEAPGEKPDATTLKLIFDAAREPVSAVSRSTESGKQIDLRIDPVRPVGAHTTLSFQYRLVGADRLALQIFDVTDRDGRRVVLSQLKQGRWASASVDFTRDGRRRDGGATPFAAGHLVDGLIFLVDGAAGPEVTLQIRDVRLYDAAAQTLWPYFRPPREYAGRLTRHRPLLRFDDGRPVKTVEDWWIRRAQIFAVWQQVMGTWPALLERPKLERISSTRRETFTQIRVRVQITEEQSTEAYVLIPDGTGPFPAVLVPFYAPETSIGLSALKLRDFAYQLTRRGYVTLAIGAPGGDALRPDVGKTQLQPLSYLAYVAANSHTALAQMPEVDPKRIGIVGHSYGGKWAMFAACLYDKFAAGVWSDAGLAFDETHPNVNYWEPWYLGAEPGLGRPDGRTERPDKDHPRTGAYKRLIEGGHDLHELQALMAPRPFLVSGGVEDGPMRWLTLNHVVAVNRVLGFGARVGMTNRPDHSPTEQSNEMIYLFFEHYLKGPGR
jgi:hypothetical protein